MSEELKPCPFCGGEASYKMHDDEWWVVSCDNCLAEGGYYDGDESTAPSDARQFWNNRPADTALKAAVISANEMAELMRKYVEDKSVSKADLALMAMSWSLQHETASKAAGEKT